MQPSYVPGGPTPMMTQPPPSAGTAKTLVLIALIFQLIGTVIILPFVFILPLFAFATGIGVIIAVVFGIVILFAIFLLYVGYAWVYQRIGRGEYEPARTPALILGILGLFVGGLITGILYLIAYVKLGDAITESQRPMTYAPAYPVTPAFYAPPAAGAPAAAPSAQAAPTCPRCGRPATYIAQYGRYYCYTDQQYL